MRDSSTLQSLLLILTLFAGTSAQATLPGGHLLVEEVIVDVGDPDTTLTIHGQDLDFGDPLVVTLAGVPATVVSASETEIVATGSAPGTGARALTPAQLPPA